MRIFKGILSAAAIATLAVLPACATQPADDAMLSRMLAGQSQLSGRSLDQAIAQAATNPLGSKENPVRAAMPDGQRAYLARLRCSDGNVPAFHRLGNTGLGPDGNFVDVYSVDCGEAAPGKASVHMDMYHAGHVENGAVPGFGLDPVS